MSKIIKTEWDLSIYYNGVNDKKIEEDIENTRKVYVAFEKKYKKNSAYLKNAIALKKALEDCEKLWQNNTYKPYLYLHYFLDTHSDNDVVRAKLNLVHQKLNEISNLVNFFTINLSKIDKKLQVEFLNDKRLSKYKYHLEKLFRTGKYNLTESEEKILSLKSIVSKSMWVDLTEKLSNQISIKHKGNNYPLSSVASLISKTKSQNERMVIQNKAHGEIEKIAEIATAEINAIVTDKKIDDELRGYKTPYEETVLSYENEPKTVENIVRVANTTIKVAHRFFKLKKKILGLDKMYFSDRLAEIGQLNKKYTYEESYRILLDLFNQHDKRWGDILRNMAENGQIDVFPRIGKRGGAYSSSQPGNPVMVLLNHMDDYHSLETFAHEMGHSIHSTLSEDKNTPFYKGYSISTAEVASTFMETLLFNSEFPKMSAKEQIIMLHNRIASSVGTIWQQISLFNFELEMHGLIKDKGSLSTQELIDLMLKRHKFTFGPVMEFSRNDGLSYVTWMHIRLFFYVYTYAGGELISRAIYANYQNDPTYIKKINQFMSMGGIMSPEDIFKSIGVDITKAEFFEEGIKDIERELDTLEKLLKKR